MTRLLAIPLACLALSACNPPHMWQQPTVQLVQTPPIYRGPTRVFCYDKWGREIPFGVQYSYGQHCHEVGMDPRPLGTGRRRVR